MLDVAVVVDKDHHMKQLFVEFGLMPRAHFVPHAYVRVRGLKFF